MAAEAAEPGARPAEPAGERRHPRLPGRSGPSEIAAAHEPIAVEVLGPADLEREGMGGLRRPSRQGTAEEPRLIVLRYAGGGEGPRARASSARASPSTPAGSRSSPPASMHEMKMDMSGGAAVLEAVAAIAELGLPLDLIAVVPATENMPSGYGDRPAT